MSGVDQLGPQTESLQSLVADDDEDRGGVEEMMRAERPFVRPHMPSSAKSCLNVSITDERPSTLEEKAIDYEQ